MAFQKTSSFSKIFITIFGIAFGLAALAMGYQAVLGNTENRSKAAETTKTIVSWPGEGRLLSEWKTNGTYTIEESWNVIAPKGAMRLTNASFTPAATLPKGTKYFQMTWTPVVSSATPTPTVTPTPVSGVPVKKLPVVPPTKYTAQWISGKTPVEKQPAYADRLTGRLHYWITVKTKAGVFQRAKKSTSFTVPLASASPTFRVAIPDIGEIVVDGLELEILSGLSVGKKIEIKWLGLVVPMSVTTPAPVIGEASITPSPATTGSGYTCPANGWVNCMPGVVNGKTKTNPSNCSTAYYNWAKANCKNFQGFAY